MTSQRQPKRDFWAGRRITITGGTGFLGYHLIQQLRELDARVRVIGLPPRADHPLLQRTDVECRLGDITSADFVADAVRDADVIFHMAGPVAMWGPARAIMHRVHVEGTRNILTHAPASARIIHTSSIVAVGAECQQIVFDESTPFNLADFRVDYVHAKRDAESLALQSDRNIVIVNPGYLLGPDDFENSVMGRLCVRFWKGRVPLAPPGGINLVDVRDVACGHLLAAEHGQVKRRYILGGVDRSYRDFFRMLADVAGMTPRGLPIMPRSVLAVIAAFAELRGRFTGKEPYPSFQHVRMNRRFWYVSSARAERELGFSARPIRETIRDTFEWFRTHQHLKLSGFNRWWMRPRLSAPLATRR